MNKLLVAIMLALSSHTFANPELTAKFFPIPILRHGIPYTAESFHTYSITNDTEEKKSVSLCFEIITCSEYPYYLKNHRECESFDLMQHESKSGVHNTLFQFSYDLTQTWCMAKAVTETTGITPARVEHDITFLVK